jgi:hypothetical protein
VSEQGAGSTEKTSDQYLASATTGSKDKFGEYRLHQSGGNPTTVVGA